MLFQIYGDNAMYQLLGLVPLCQALCGLCRVHRLYAVKV